MSERFVPIEETELWIAEQGSGMPLLLTPGGPGCCDYLEPVASMLEDGLRVVRWEPRGCGASESEGPHDVETTLADMDAIREDLGIERWLVGGHSHGAFLSLAYALEYPERVEGILYLAGSGVQNDRDWHRMYSEARETIGELEPDYAYPHNMQVNREGNDSARAYCRDPFLWQRIGRLDAPMLAVVGGEDIRPSWPAEQLAHAMPRASVAVLPEAGHCMWLTHAESLRAVMRAFLSPWMSPQAVDARQ